MRKYAQVLRDAGSAYAVSQQYPKEVQERRRALVPIMKQARLNGSEAYLVVDKLYIDKHLYRDPVAGPPAGPPWGTASGPALSGTPGHPHTSMSISTPGSAPGSSAWSALGSATSAPGPVYGPPHMFLPTPGSAPGSSAGLTLGSAMGPAPGVSSGSVWGSGMGLAPGSVPGTDETGTETNHGEMEADDATK